MENDSPGRNKVRRNRYEARYVILPPLGLSRTVDWNH